MVEMAVWRWVLRLTIGVGVLWKKRRLERSQ